MRKDLSTDLIAARYMAGDSSKKIAADLGCCVRTVFLRLRKAGVSSRPQGKVKTWPGGVNPRRIVGRGTAARRWHERNPERAARIQYAGNRVKDAVASGRLVRPSICEECGGGGEIQAAHFDYDRPLDVRWLCRRCHSHWDRAKPKSNVIFRVRGEHQVPHEALRIALTLYVMESVRRGLPIPETLSHFAEAAKVTPAEAAA